MDALEDTRMVVVEEMALAEKSGVLFRVDPVLNHRGHMVIEAIYGLGEGIVSGSFTPDHYVVDHQTGALVREFIPVQTAALVYDPESGCTVEIAAPEEQGAARI